jgi:hypothetical protein
MTNATILLDLINSRPEGGGILGENLTPSSDSPSMGEAWIAGDEHRAIIERAIGAEEDAEFKADLDELLRNTLTFRFGEFIDRTEPSPKREEEYRGHMKLFLRWCKDSAPISPLPASAPVVAEYLAELIDLGSRPSTIKGIVETLSYWHRLHDYLDPCTDELVKAVVKSTEMRTKKDDKKNGTTITKHVEHEEDEQPNPLDLEH